MPALPVSRSLPARTIIAEPAQVVARGRPRRHCSSSGCPPRKLPMSGPALAMAEGRATALTVFLVAAEESGDRLGAALMRALAVRTRGAVRCVGHRWRATWRQKDCRPSPRSKPFAFIGYWRLNPAPAGTHPRAFARPPNAVVASAAGRTGHHRQPRFHPSHRAHGARAQSGISRSSIMSAPPSGRGGRDGRRRCAAISITCWRCCRSSQRHLPSLHGPACTYVGHPLIEEIDRAAARMPRRRARRRADPPLVAGAARQPRR